MFELVLGAVLVTGAAVGATSVPAVGPTGDITFYPAYSGQIVRAGVEAIVERGPIAELIINCRPGSAIISYSKIERVFCTPSQGCHGSLRAAVGAVCR